MLLQEGSSRYERSGLSVRLSADVKYQNIPRGKTIERDARADNPFLDTTEYIMNKMIQRQEIVPPWIEKQQELVKAANVFRARLRNDWKRQAARTVASRGGSLEEQMRTAERYAEAELVYNPKKRAVEKITIPTNATDDPVMAKIREETPSQATPNKGSTPLEVSIESSEAEITISQHPTTDAPSSASEIPPTTSPPTPSASLPALFRIPSWIQTESSYLNLSISNLNLLTRSYNLMAPDLAKKPYFSLERELNACYADVAPVLADEIRERALRPPKKDAIGSGDGSGGVMGWLNGGLAGQRVVIHRASRPAYGFKEWWRDVRPWGKRSGEV